MTTELPTTPPDFYLSSLEDANLALPRACWRIKRVKGDRRDDFLLIRLDRPLLTSVYGPYGLNRDADVIIVAPRLSGMHLFPIDRWPVYVYVSPLKVEHPENLEAIHDGEYLNLTWGELYPDYLSAEEKKQIYP